LTAACTNAPQSGNERGKTDHEQNCNGHGITSCTCLPYQWTEISHSTL